MHRQIQTLQEAKKQCEDLGYVCSGVVKGAYETFFELRRSIIPLRSPSHETVYLKHCLDQPRRTPVKVIRFRVIVIPIIFIQYKLTKTKQTDKKKSDPTHGVASVARL